jgi:hypothetical protein
MAWTVRGDIKGCFDEIDRPILSGLLKKIIPDALFLSIITESIEAPMVNKGFLKRTYRGIPQGRLFLLFFQTCIFIYSTRLCFRPALFLSGTLTIGSSSLQIFMQRKKDCIQPLTLLPGFE